MNNVSIPSAVMDRLVEYLEWEACDPNSTEQDRADASGLLRDLHAACQ